MSGIFTLISFILGFVIAQAAKCIILTIKGKRQQKATNFGQVMRYLTHSGGTPSGHSASFVAAATFLGFSEGFTSPIFALAVCTTIIVIYDAVNVRYAVGEQGKLLAKIIKKQNYILPKPQIIEGHTMPQVSMGSLVGILVGWLVFIMFGAL